MAKQRTNRQDSKWCRFVDWVNGTPQEMNQEQNQMVEQSEVKASQSHANAAHENTDVAPKTAAGRLIAASFENLDDETKLQRYLESFQEKGMALFNKAYRVLSVLICICIISVLMITVSVSPTYGDPNAPGNNEVAERYITKGIQETGAVNIVTGMILDYRAFDTFGESNVLFVAACTVLILLRLDKGGEENDREYEPKNDVILQRVATCLVPPTLIFGIYVILNGHLSPGGGFSGGAIIGAGLILYTSAFGFKKTEKFFTMKTFKAVSFGALLFYGLSKSYSFFTGANHLESGIPLGTPGAILSSGLILPLNICVGLVVACTMYGFYALFRKGGI